MATWYGLQILSTVFTVFAICKFVFVTKKLDSGEKNTKMMWLHIALLLLQNACATIYFLQADVYFYDFSKASISTQPYLSLVVADLLIQILIIYIVLKMGASAQLRHYHCHLTQVENGGLRIVFKPRHTVDDASDTASYTQLDD